MTRAATKRSLLLGALCILAACGRPDLVNSKHSPIESATDEMVVDNGIELNGVKLNGVKLNGVKLNGVKLNGVKLNGNALSNVTLAGTSLSGYDIHGSLIQGPNLVGAELTGHLSDGTTLRLRIDDVQQSTTDAEVYLYDVKYEAKGNHWRTLCYDGNAPVAATALAGTWDYGIGTPTGGSWIPPSSSSDTEFTFACVGSALEKCVSFGYKPWDSVDGQSEQPLHQACTRMLRADYCGDGEPNTINGTAIDIYDNYGIQTDTENWPFEAEWNESGARCFLETRKGTPFTCAVPHTFDVTSGCGSLVHFNTGTLLMDETLGVSGHGGDTSHGHHGH